MYYRRATHATRKFGDDAYAARHADLRLKSPLSDSDILQIQAENALRSGSYDSAKILLQRLIALPSASADVLAEAVYDLGLAFYEQKEYSEARSRFQEALNRKIDREQWLTPWSHYYRGICHAKLGNEADARKDLEQVLDFDEYDFKNWLAFRTKRELEKLEHNRTG